MRLDSDFSLKRRKPSRASDLLTFRWTLWAGVTDRIEHVTNFGKSLVGSDAGRRILTGESQGALSCMRIGTILNPSLALRIRGLSLPLTGPKCTSALPPPRKALKFKTIILS
jgi:hypothetical protein